MMRAVLAFPGDLATPSGGYAYDRRVLAGMAAAGIALAPLALPAGFPHPAQAAQAEALARLAATPAGAPLLVDGLALGALPPERVAALRRPVVALVHHPLALEEGLAPETAARLAANERAVLALCRRVVATSAHTARLLARDYGVSGARLAVAEPGTDPAPRAAANGVPPRLLAVGAVIPRKGHGVLVEALAGLAGLDWSATIVGSLAFDPAAAARLKAQIAAAGLGGRIILAGALERPALEAAYQGCDLFVHPAFYEGYGMALAEALRRGLPVIATTGGAAAETVPEGAGLKVPPGDAAALRAALAGLIADPDARLALAERAFDAGCRLPSWDDTCRRIAITLAAAQEA